MFFHVLYIQRIFHHSIFYDAFQGTSANSLNFQIYLLEGLHRWNQDRGSAALSTGPSGLCSYSGDLLHCVNKFMRSCLAGRQRRNSVHPLVTLVSICEHIGNSSQFKKLLFTLLILMIHFISVVSGELIGVQYLFRQTGQALQDMHPDSEETAQLIEQHDVEDNVEDDEGFCDITDDPTVQDLEALRVPASPTPGLSTITSGLSSVVHSTSSVASTVSTAVNTPQLTSSMAPSISTLVSSISTLVSNTSTMTTGKTEQFITILLKSKYGQM